mmetsp:Transcript_35949/g.44348  ORF Transcript_35949/g.44348 Transcript_35949/m.44348 type:complete len:108 (-) Transcript_35949:119-442(-)
MSAGIVWMVVGLIIVLLCLIIVGIRLICLNMASMNTMDYDRKNESTKPSINHDINKTSNNDINNNTDSKPLSPNSTTITLTAKDATKENKVILHRQTSNIDHEYGLD